MYYKAFDIVQNDFCVYILHYGLFMWKWSTFKFSFCHRIKKNICYH